MVVAESRTTVRASTAESRATRAHLRPTLEALAVAGLSALVGVLLSADGPDFAVVGEALPLPATRQLLTLTGAAAGTGAAILAVVTSRLLGDRGPVWIAAALVLHCLIVLPWSAIASDAVDPGQRASWLVAQSAALVLLLLAVRPSRWLGARGAAVVLVVGGLLAAVALWLPVDPSAGRMLDGPALTTAVLAGWATAAAAFAVAGLRAPCAARLRIGLGLAVLAVAQLGRVVAGVPSAAEQPAVAGLRLLGFVVVLVGLAQLVQRALRDVRTEQWQHQEELTAAALDRERATELAAERNHELRNGLAGLAGITHLLGDGTGGTDHERLKHAVLAELGRLHTILDGGATEGDGSVLGPELDYLVEPVLAGLAALRRSGVGRLRLHVEPGLCARGRSVVLAQVVTNLLANCDRHAPGAPITITARRGDPEPADGTSADGVVVEIRDEGPGLLPGTEDAVLDRGVRDERAGGSGLGLHISRRLVEREGGALGVRTVDEPRGCLATVTVPGAAPAGRSGPAAAPSAAPSQW